MDQNVKEVQNIGLEILKEFIRICDIHNLRYFLGYGSAIGTVRHQGFIPWDDDIDVFMPREDYELFCEICKKELDSKFFLQNYKTEPACSLIWGKLRKNNTLLVENYNSDLKFHFGVWIDIFILDKVSDNHFIRLINKCSLFILKNLYIVKCNVQLPPNRLSFINKLCYNITKVFAKPLSKNFLINNIDKLLKKYQHKNTKFVMDYSFFKGLLIECNQLNTYKVMPFEDINVRMFDDYDKILKQYYGDYMRIPTEEERKNGSGHYVNDFKTFIETDNPEGYIVYNENK